jgi:hypothetical protein
MRRANSMFVLCLCQNPNCLSHSNPQRSQRHVNHLNNIRDRGNGHRIKLSLQTIGKGSVFSDSERAILPGWPGRRWSGNSHHPFVNPPQQLVFGIKEFECRAPLVVPPLLGQRFNELSRRLISAVRVGSLATCHCFSSRVFRCISSWISADIGGRGSSGGRRLKVKCAWAFITAP